MMRMVLFKIESAEGDTEKLVPENKVVDEVNKLVADDKWVTLEGQNGKSELVTAPIAEPKKPEDTPEENTDWQKSFGGAAPANNGNGGFKDLGPIKQATATSKLKGG
jgi:hypothetical protein